MNNAIQAFIDFISQRARKAGYGAYHAGAERRAPAGFGEYSGAWVEGWNAAMLDALAAPATPMALAAA